MRRSDHLVLKYYDVLESVQFCRDWQLVHCQTKGRLDQDKQSQDHLLVPLINCLVGLGIGELLVVSSQVERGEGGKSEFFILHIFVVI